MSCTKCLLTADSSLEVLRFFWPGVKLKVAFSEGGLCTFCRDCEKYRNPQALDDEWEDFLGCAEGPIFVAYSGGKDSTATLYWAKQNITDRPIIAALYDNGFIPASVIRYAQEICRKLDVELLIDKPDDFSDSRLLRSFRRAQKGRFRGPRNDVCSFCSTAFNRRFDQLMQQRGANSRLTGNNFWTYSPHTALDHEREDGPDHMLAVSVYEADDGQELQDCNLPFSRQLTYAYGQRVLAEVGFHDTAIFEGYTTNCILSDFQEHIRQKHGFAQGAGREYLSIEISANYISKEDAQAILAVKKGAFNEQLMRMVQESMDEGLMWSDKPVDLADLLR